MASTNIDLDLVKLTESLTKKIFKDKWQGGGLLGGKFGYGVNYENEVFMMHQFCWCEREDCDWCAMNNKKLQHKLFKKYGDKKFAEWGYTPNFWHKKSGLQIRWYKWIGRDMEFNKKITNKKWIDIFQECIKSITPRK